MGLVTCSSRPRIRAVIISDGLDFFLKKMWRRKTDSFNFPLLASTVHPLYNLSIRKASTECSSRYRMELLLLAQVINSKCLSISSSFPLLVGHHTSCSLQESGLCWLIWWQGWRGKDGWYPYASSCFFFGDGRPYVPGGTATNHETAISLGPKLLKRVFKDYSWRRCSWVWEGACLLSLRFWSWSF